MVDLRPVECSGGGVGRCGVGRPRTDDTGGLGSYIITDKCDCILIVLIFSVLE